MKRLLLALALLASLPAVAQETPIYCVASALTVCNTVSNPGNHYQGDSAWLAFGKLNAWGTQLGILANQPANEVLATPSGASGIPGVRALVGADIPPINLAGGSSNGGVSGVLPVANGGTGLSTVTAGQCLGGNSGGTGYTYYGCNGSAFQANGTPLANQATVNFENSASTNGLTLAFLNPSLGVLQLELLGQLSLTTGVSGILPVANGGTGTSSPGLIAGTNVTITGAWPDQTINSGASMVYPAAGLANSTGTAWGTSVTTLAGLDTVLGITGTPSSTTYLRGDGTWATPAGSGTVNSGTANQVGCYTATGTAISGCTTLPTAAMPALSGDVTSTGGTTSVTVSKVNGLPVPPNANCLSTNGSAQPVAGCPEPTTQESGTSYIADSTWCGTLRVFTSGSAIGLSLPEIASCQIDFSVQGAGTLTITPSAGTINGSGSALTVATNRQATLNYDSTDTNWGCIGCTALVAGGGGTSDDVQTFTSSGTWTKPSGNPKLTKVICVAPGGGGGSGAVYPSGTASSGGAGGGGGSYAEAIFPTSSLTSTVTVTLGAPGAGGTAISTTSTAGNAGGNATNTTFGSYLTAYGGQGGTGGASAALSTGGGGAGPSGVGGGAGTPCSPAGGAGSNGADPSCIYGGAGGAGGTASGSFGGGGSSILGGSGGGSGGGLTTGAVTSQGGVSGNTMGALGVAGGAAGAAGNAGGASPGGAYIAGSGGSGSGSSTTASLAGGAGALGAGGGGSGSGETGSGAGGTGGTSECVAITTY